MLAKESISIGQDYQKHLAFLEKSVFQIDTKWPHYRRLLDDLVTIAETAPVGSNILCLERAFIFGGQSLFAPLFEQRELKFRSIDIRLQGLTEDRTGYQEKWLDHPDCRARPVSAVSYVDSLPVESGSIDILIVPNIVHHIQDQGAMFKEFARVLKSGGRGYIFETLLRELHQMPFDYVRWTPSGFEGGLSAVGLELTDWRSAGGPFEAIAYCWDQALQYMPPEVRTTWEHWFRTQHFAELMTLHAEYKENLQRKFTAFPIAYGIDFLKK